jgi:hypothetical protein
VFNHQDLNAMALPDGRIYVTSKMAAVVTDEELAYVLGHEITHVVQKHSEHQSTKTTIAAVLGAVVTAALGGDEQDVRLGAEVVGGLVYGQYSRADEHRADDAGTRLMATIGYNPHKAADMMQRLIDAYGRGDAHTPVIGWFASHPDSGDRKARLTALANALDKNPPARATTPWAVDIALAPSAEHAKGWARDYLAYQIALYGQGRALAMPSTRISSPMATTAPLPTPPAGAASAVRGARSAAPALPTVTVRMPNFQTGYRVSLGLREVEARTANGGIDDHGTAVEATLTWRETTTGFTGVISAGAQTRTRVAWMAHEQLRVAADVTRLSDGRHANAEGTLEGLAVQRVARAFAELVEAGGPVHHPNPITLTRPAGDVRVGDYLAIVRGGWVVAEVRLTRVTNRQVMGDVLWGTHTLQRGDRVQPEV